MSVKTNLLYTMIDLNNSEDFYLYRILPNEWREWVAMLYNMQPNIKTGCRILQNVATLCDMQQNTEPNFKVKQPTTFGDHATW